jgi:uncharacterized protein
MGGVWAKSEVSLVLSGMSTLEQVQSSIESACRPGTGTFGDDDARLVTQVQKEYGRLSPIPCTRCAYCMPCAEGVNIPVNIELFNNASVFKGGANSLCKNQYNSLPEVEQARACVKCRICEDKCPQGIRISEVMSRVQEHFK